MNSELEIQAMKRLDMASRLLEENDSILSATQKEELVAMIQKM